MIDETDTSAGRNRELFTKVLVGADVEVLNEAARKIIAEHPLAFTGTRQVALQHRLGSDDPWYEACREVQHGVKESEFAVWNDGVEMSPIGHALASLPFPVFRARLMALDSRYCYSVHKDATSRMHIALQTSEHALFIYPVLDTVVHVPMDGHAYIVDTTHDHTAMNGGRDLRLHLVAGINLNQISARG